VNGSARLFHESIVEDDAFIGPLVTLRENARIGGSAILTMGTIVRGDAYVGGTSVITGCKIEGRARVIDVTLSGAYTLR
jgi:UDP-3-O-[3-hydroxymyristoyl] glucosamine N-acyltransferase